MRRWKFCLLIVAASACLASFAVGTPAMSARAGSSNSQSLCIAHPAQEFVWYSSSCTGHDEPAIDRSRAKPGRTGGGSPVPLRRRDLAGRNRLR